MLPDQLVVQLSIRETVRYAGEFVKLLQDLPEAQLWEKPRGIPNAIGTLARHLTGNFNHYFGAGILGNGYVRQRDFEFVESGLSKEKVLADLQQAIEIVIRAGQHVTDEQLQRRPYASPDGQDFESLAYHLARLATHCALHYGQADYLRNFLAA
jgi:hypothetical protein